MDVKFFDSLSRRDFDNGAILDDIRKALAENEKLREVVKTSFEEGVQLGDWRHATRTLDQMWEESNTRAMLEKGTDDSKGK